MSTLFFVGITGIALFSSLACAAADPHRQFDFWLGEWDVTNRHLNNAVWSDSGQSRAFIRPVLGGRAVLEQWAGNPGGMHSVFEFSLRWYDEALERWVVILNWPSGSPATPGFGRMEGVFDESGACALFPPSTFAGPGGRRSSDAIRYRFSDATPESCRWTMASPGARGSFHDSWTMDFARAAPGTDEPLAITPAPESCACDTDEARTLDDLVGVWSHDDTEVRISSAIRGCLTFVSVRVGTGDVGADDRFLVLACDPASGDWSGRSVDGDLRAAVWQGERDGDALVLRSTGASDAARRGEVLRLGQIGGALRIELERAGEVVQELTLDRG